MKRNSPAQTPARPKMGAVTKMNAEEVSPTSTYQSHISDWEKKLKYYTMLLYDRKEREP